MPKALGALGWIAGPLCIFAFYAISIVSSWLLASLFEVNGVQHPRYFEAVAAILGEPSCLPPLLEGCGRHPRRVPLLACCLGQWVCRGALAVGLG